MRISSIRRHPHRLKMRNRDVYEKVARGECDYAELIDALYGEVRQAEVFDKCANAIRYISIWYTQDFNYDASSATLRDKLLKIANAQSLDGFDMSMLPKMFQNVPVDNIKKCLNAALSRGAVNAAEALPIIVNALNCIRYG